jgi:hypothetical protein
MSRPRDERFEASERGRIQKRQAAINRAFPRTQHRADGVVQTSLGLRGIDSRQARRGAATTRQQQQRAGLAAYSRQQGYTPARFNVAERLSTDAAEETGRRLAAERVTARKRVIAPGVPDTRGVRREQREQRVKATRAGQAQARVIAAAQQRQAKDGAARVLQSATRTRLAQRDLANVRRAATTVQRAARARAAGAQARRKDLAATVLQSAARRRQASTRYDDMLWAAGNIQDKVRARQRFQRAATDYRAQMVLRKQALHIATTRIAARQRGNITRARLAEERARAGETAAATTLQSVVRARYDTQAYAVAREAKRRQAELDYVARAVQRPIPTVAPGLSSFLPDASVQSDAMPTSVMSRRDARIRTATSVSEQFRPPNTLKSSARKRNPVNYDLALQLQRTLEEDYPGTEVPEAQTLKQFIDKAKGLVSSADYIMAANQAKASLVARTQQLNPSLATAGGGVDLGSVSAQPSVVHPIDNPLESAPQPTPTADVEPEPGPAPGVDEFPDLEPAADALNVDESSDDDGDAAGVGFFEASTEFDLEPSSDVGATSQPIASGPSPGGSAPAGRSAAPGVQAPTALPGPTSDAFGNASVSHPEASAAATSSAASPSTTAPAAAAAAAGSAASTATAAATVLESVKESMVAADPETIAQLAQTVENDPSIKRLVALGALKYSDLLTTKDGKTVVDTTKLAEITRQLKMRGLRAQGQAQQTYASYARQRTVPQVKPLANGLRVVTGPRWMDPTQHVNSMY